MSQSKLLSAEQRIVNGVQETWVSDKGTFYKYNVKFENGDVGVSMGKNSEPSYIIGAEYTYEKKVNGVHTTFSGVKKVEVAGQQSDYVSFWDKPRTIHYKMKPVCYKLATRYFSILPATVKSSFAKEDLTNKINMLASEMFNFVMELSDTNQRWARIALMEVALAEAVELPVLSSVAKLEGIRAYVLEAEKCINTNAPA